MTVLAESGVGYRQHRIPALTVTPRGVLVAAYDGRPDLDDLPAPIDLVMRHSHDLGRTWSDPEVIRGAEGLTGYGDASLLADPETGRLFCFHAAGRAVGFFESGDGDEDCDPGLLHCDLGISDDGGASWAFRRLTHELRRGINAHLNGARVSGLFAASGSGATVSLDGGAGYSGHVRLLQGFVALIGTDLFAAVARSDDHGQTWRVSAPLGPGANEFHLADLGGGRVLLQSRAIGRRLASTSYDGGATWTPLRPVSDLPDPGNNGSLARLPDGTLIATHTADPDLRSALVVSASADGGATWRVAARLTGDGAGYSAAVALPDGSLGVLWEDEGYRRLLFTRLPASALDGDARLDETPAWEAALVLDHVIPARPDEWVDVGERLDLDLADTFGPGVFKIVADAAGAQRVATKEAYDANLGPVHPGLATGAVLVCSGRLSWDGMGAPPDLAWQGAPVPAECVTAVGAGDDPDGARLIARGLRHIVSGTDVEAGRVHLWLSSADGRAHAELDVPILPTDCGATRPRALAPPHPTSTAPARPAPTATKWSVGTPTAHKGETTCTP